MSKTSNPLQTSLLNSSLVKSGLFFFCAVMALADNLQDCLVARAVYFEAESVRTARYSRKRQGGALLSACKAP